MRLIILSCFLLASVLSIAQNTDSDKRKKHYNLSKGTLAVEGYDVVSYHTGKPLKGVKSFSTIYNGITYYLSSQNNLNVFKKTPDKYEPVYGGWCAFAMGDSGEKVEVDPETYKIVDGKLYLFYNAYLTNTLPKWNKDEKNLKTKAERNWLLIYK